MNAEIPVCTKCCFCLPLRHGLIAWGYFKLIIDAILCTVMGFLLLNILLSVMMSGNGNGKYVAQLLMLLLITLTTFLIFVTDFVMTIVFIVGGHKKNVKLMRVFYFFSIAMWILTLLLSVAFIGLSITNTSLFGIELQSSKSLATIIPLYLVTLAVQTYFLLLLRSEIMKLSNKCEFKIVNNAADEEYTMNKGEVAGEEMDSEFCNLKRNV